MQSFTSLEIGRRKLPSIPTQHAEKVSGTSPAPVYLASSASVASSSPDRQYHAWDLRAYSQPTSRTASLSNLSLPSSSSSAHSRTVDPTILPGAAIVDAKPKLHLRQTTSAAVRDRSTVLGQASGTKMPSPLARVLLKKELKEVLERRRESLEACEIEANQRQYIVHRMLITGLLPEYRSIDIDNVPDVIPCLLPVELISGARVIPSEAPSTTTSVTTTLASERSSAPPFSISVQTDTQEVGISTDDLRSEPKLKSVGVQSENSFGSAAASTAIPSSVSFATTTSLRKQMKQDRLSAMISNTDVTTSQPRFRFTETQTNGKRTYETYSTRSSCRRNSPNDSFSASEPNLLESTAKYFAEYDRQLREHGRMLKNRFAFSDDDPINRETRKQRVMDELAQRKEKISSLIDLYPSSSFPVIHPTSDYSSTVPHYGSLPRIDFLAAHSPRSNRREHVNRNRSRLSFGYASLPRNYEHCIGRDYGEAYFQSLPFPAGRYDTLSRSRHVNSNTAEDPILDPRTRLYATRSMNHLHPWLSMESGVTFGRPLMKAAYDDMYRPPYLPGTRAQNFGNFQSLPNTDIISQYANYLSNQYLTDQQKLTSGYEAEEQMYLSQPRKRLYPVPRYGSSTTSGQALAGLNYEDPTPSLEVGSALHRKQSVLRHAIPDPHANHSSFVQSDKYESWLRSPHSHASSSMPDNNSVAPYYNSYHFPQAPNTHPGASPLHGQVYSRNDTDYGSRSSHYATEYGNYYRDLATHQLRDSSYRSYASRNRIPYIPHSSHYHASNRYLGHGEQPYSPNQPLSPDNYHLIPQQPSHAVRAWSNWNSPVNSYDAIYPKEDALNSMHTTLNNPRSIHPQYYGNGATLLTYS